MRLRSFHAASLSEAMQQVRLTLGDDAIIVSTRDEESGGVRVTAAIDEKQNAETKNDAAQIADEDHGSEILEKIAKALLSQNVTTSLAERLLAATMQFANDDPVLALGSALDTHLSFALTGDETPTKPLLFVGLPGSGKTLSVAKYATKATLARRKVSVFGTDTERAGGMQQLAAFTRLLRVGLTEIDDPHALHDAVRLTQQDLVLIDTAGCNPFDATDRKRTESLIKAVGGDAILVLPADAEPHDAIDTVRLFQDMGVTRALVTRLDLTRRLGGLLRVAFETKIPLAASSATANVTIPPAPLNPITLARLLLPQDLQKESNTLNAPIPLEPRATGTGDV